MRVSELEAHASALAVLNDRLNRSRDALVDDAFTAEDLLCAAAERMRRSRGSRSSPAAAGGAGGSGGGGDIAGSAEFAAGRLSGRGGRGRGAARGRRWSQSPSPRLSASVPEWHGGGSSSIGDGGGWGGGRLRSSLPPGARRGAWDEEGDEAMGGRRRGRDGDRDRVEDGDGEANGALVVASAAAMDVLREVERMHVGAGSCCFLPRVQLIK